MRKMMVGAWAVVAAMACAGVVYGADKGELLVKVDMPGVKISPKLYGLMTEEINHAYDGGLYAELIQNRIFMDAPKEGAAIDPTKPPHWSLVKGSGVEAGMMIDTTEPVNSTELTRSLRVDVKGGN